MKSRAEEIAQARREALRSGWIHQILNNQNSEGYWVNSKSCYQPKFSATVWQLQLLAMLEANADAKIKNACDRFLQMHDMPDGGFTCSAPENPHKRSEECIVGRMLAVLIHFGCDDLRIQRAMRWLLDRQIADGGWNCRYGSRPKHSSIYSTYMALWGLSKTPKRKRTKEINGAISGGIEFLLRHMLFKSHRSGQVIKSEWTMLHFPPVNYDILGGLRLMTDLGITSDERLSDALDLVESKMQKDGRWLTEYVPRGTKERSGQPSIKFYKAGEPNKWITLQSLIVLSRTGRINQVFSELDNSVANKLI